MRALIHSFTHSSTNIDRVPPADLRSSQDRVGVGHAEDPLPLQAWLKGYLSSLPGNHRLCRFFILHLEKPSLRFLLPPERCRRSGKLCLTITIADFTYSPVSYCHFFDRSNVFPTWAVETLLQDCCNRARRWVPLPLLSLSFQHESLCTEGRVESTDQMTWPEAECCTWDGKLFL